MTNDRLVSVIVSTRDRRDSLDRTLVALRAQTHPAFEVVVVDNASTDGTLEMVRRVHPDVRLLAPGANRGYARSINAGVAASKGDTLVFLPDDVITDPTYVAELVAALETTRASIVGGVLLEWPETSRINYAGASLSRALRLRFERDHLPEGDAPREVTFVPGGNLAIRRHTFDALGGFDEDYASFFEDVDLCVRAMRTGHRLALAPRARAYHLSHPSAPNAYRAFYDRRNVALFYFKHAGTWLLPAFCAYQLSIGLSRDVVWALTTRDRDILRAVLRGHGWWIANLGELRRKRAASRRSRDGP